MAAKTVLRAVALVVIAVCAVPGLLYVVLQLVELRTIDPFTSNRAKDMWFGWHLVNFFVLEYTSPVLVPLMWIMFWLARPLPSALRNVLIAVMGLSTLGVVLFWGWALR